MIFRSGAAKSDYFTCLSFGVNLTDEIFVGVFVGLEVKYYYFYEVLEFLLS